jgi:mannan polymerase II complex MNN11 subunit
VQTTDYHTDAAPKSWTKLMAMRHALTKFPDCGHIWHLDQNALIMEPKATLKDVMLDKKKLRELMQQDVPVVSGSIIKTSAHLQPEDVGLIISQDKHGLVTDSMVIKNGEWAKFLLEKWLDPLYQSYNFEKAERHALVSFVFLVKKIIIKKMKSWRLLLSTWEVWR